ncbi:MULTISPECIES: hypothetical protein [unclassified Marinovum]
MKLRPAAFASSTSFLALSLSMMGYGRGAYAGDCIGGPNDFYCTGPADPATDMTQAITVTSGDLTITGDPYFGHYTAAGDGISVTTTDTAGGVILDLTSGYSYVRGEGNGITVEAGGSGPVLVGTGTVIGHTEDGVDVTNSANGTDLTVVATGHVVGALNGMSVVNRGSGETSVTTTGIDSVSADDQGLIVAGSGTDLSIVSTGHVNSGGRGIAAINNGSGALTIQSEDVTGAGSDGILAANLGGTDLTVHSTGYIAAESHGVLASNQGTGTTEITTHTVTSEEGYGVAAINMAQAGQLSITTTGLTEGHLAGVRALNHGTGGVTLTLADVSGGDFSAPPTPYERGYGVSAYQGENTDSGVSIVANGSVRGTYIGLSATSWGTISVVSQGEVYGRDRAGIDTLSFYGTTIDSAGPITGATGINANNWVSGELSISVTDVTGTDGNGIRVAQRNLFSYYDPAPDGDITITATGAVQASGAYSNGIYAYHGGNGAIRITANDVSGDGTGAGIVAVTVGDGDTEIVSTGSVSGGAQGISSLSYGAGDVSIDAVDVSTSLDHNSNYTSAAVDARNIGATGEVNVTTTGTVYGRNIGIRTRNESGDDTTITATDVVGQNVYGIFASQTGDGMLNITSTGTVTGGLAGVRVGDIGGGANITVNNVTTTGYSDVEFPSTYVYDPSTGYYEPQSLGRFYGLPAHTPGHGILVDDLTYDPYYGTPTFGAPGTSGPLNITVTGLVDAAADGIRIDSDAQAFEMIDIADTATVVSQNGDAIDASHADTFLRVAGTLVGGDVLLNDGNDQMLVTGRGADLSNLDRVDGGDDDDLLIFDDTRQQLDLFENFEETRITNFSDVILSNAAFTTDVLRIEAGSLLGVFGQSTINADMSGLMGGLLTSADFNPYDQLTVNGDFAGATLFLDVALDDDNAADRLVVNGATNTGSTTFVYLLDVGSGTIDLSASPDEGIQLIEVNGASSDGDFVLADGPYTFGPSVYDLGRGASGDFFFDAVGMSGAGMVYPAISGLFEDYWSHAGGRFGPPQAAGVGNQLSLSSQGTGTGTGTGMGLDTLWFKLQTTQSEKTQAVSASGVTQDAETSLRFGGFEVGAGVPLETASAGDWSATASLGYVIGALDVDNASTGRSAGSAETTGVSATVGLRYVDQTGLFAHAELGALFGDINVNTAAGDRGDTQGRSFSAKVGVGRSFTLGSGLVVAPSGQVSVIHTSIDSFTDSSGLKTSIDDRMVYRGRLGADAFKTINFADSSLTLQGGLFVEHETADNDRTATLAGASVSGEGSDITSGEVSFGLGWSDEAGTRTAYTQLSYKEALGGQEAQSLSAAVGLEIRF